MYDPLQMTKELVNPATVNLIEQGTSLRGKQIADRWASTAPDRMLELEANGTLVDRLKKQQTVENSALSDARVHEANRGLPESEILAMMGVDLNQHL